MRREVPPEREALLRAGELEGITDSEATALRERFGNNVIAEYQARSARQLAGDTAHDPMLWFLLVTSIVFAGLGELSDAAVLMLALMPLIGMDFYLHRRTEASLKGLRSALATRAVVIRRSGQRAVSAGELVAGDLVSVTAGEAFPADGVIVAGNDLQADESSLTGEAYPVAKRPVSPGEPVLVEENWIFAGTRLLTGAAHVRLLFTGRECLYGEIVAAATGTRDERTPLQLAVAGLVRLLLMVAVAICLLLAGIRLYQGHGLIDAFLSAAVLAVAAIPEEFPVALTFFLGVGAYRLAKSKALVRRAVAVENIGRVGVICSDKTGTITEGRLRLQELRGFAETSPERLLELGARAAREASHDPLDEALRAAAPLAPSGWTLVRTFPFTEARRKEVAIWEAGSGTLAVAKGAPETIVGLCDLSPAQHEQFDKVLAELSSSGQKVIGCAFRQDLQGDVEPSDGFTLAGLIGIADPVREGVRDAVAIAQGAGIRVVMVTGDHPRTAEAIAREAGLATNPTVISGDELEQRIDAGERAFLSTLDVIARASPSQKAKLVRAMREDGTVTAVTGDGVNDVPALKVADIGIAMGLRGTQSAREVAAIVLMDDNFATIIKAITEGRQLFANLSQSFAFLLVVHIPLVTTAATIPLLDFPLLYLPIHIVVLELFIHPAAILGFQQKPGPTVTKGVPRGAGFFSARQITVICVTGLVVAIGVGWQFISALGEGASIGEARTLAFFVLLSALSATLAILSSLKNLSSRLVVCAAAAFVLATACVPGVASWFDFTAVGWKAGLLASGLGILFALPNTAFRLANSSDSHQKGRAREGELPLNPKKRLSFKRGLGRKGDPRA
ncbi:cation-translocating P-type ATPase [Pacificimonas sp. ICDLI1SI03]